jgi:hypothetical protein
MMDYADKLLRGISNPQWIDAEGRPSGELFQFDVSSRIEGFSETSINWYDDEGALEHILSQRKKDEDTFQFKAGAAVIPRNSIDFLVNQPLYNGLIKYDRDELPDNKYHGNILRKTDLPKQTRNIISQSIAITIESVATRT